MRNSVLFASSIALALATIAPVHLLVDAREHRRVLGEPSLSTLQIGVETYKDVMQLNGFVDSAQVKHRTGALALAVPGVESVRNNLVVK